MSFGQTVRGVRGADGAVRSIKDVGEYDVWTTIVTAAAQVNELQGFTYAVGQNVSGTAVGSTKLDTNLRSPGNFVDESMNVYAITHEILPFTVIAFNPAAGYFPVTADLKDIMSKTLFRFYVGGEKPFAEGLLQWFPQAGGISGFSVVNNDFAINNGVPTPASARKWAFTLPIGRIETFRAEFQYPRGALNCAGIVAHVIRLMGVRARGVQ